MSDDNLKHMAKDILEVKALVAQVHNLASFISRKVDNTNIEHYSPNSCMTVTELLGQLMTKVPLYIRLPRRTIECSLDNNKLVFKIQSTNDGFEYLTGLIGVINSTLYNRSEPFDASLKLYVINKGETTATPIVIVSDFINWWLYCTTNPT